MPTFTIKKDGAEWKATQADEGGDATASGASLAAVVAELTGDGKTGNSLSEVVPGKSAVLVVS
jgi:hypothetical protein